MATSTVSRVLNGRVSWFGGPHDPTSGPTTASDTSIKNGGIAVYNQETLGGWWEVTFPNGRRLLMKQTDIGPAPSTGRVLDVAYSSLAAAGYNEHDFPTDGTIHARYVGGGKGEAKHSHGTGGVLGAIESAAGKGLTALPGLPGIGTFPGLNQALGGAGGAANTVKDAVEAAEKVASIPDWITKGGPLKLLLDFVLIAAGMTLLVYGVMVAVRPRERALSVPRPSFVPVPV